MNKLRSTAKKLDGFFHILQVLSAIAWISSLVSLGIYLICLFVPNAPDIFDAGNTFLELGCVELQVAGKYVPDRQALNIQACVVLTLCTGCMLVYWQIMKSIRQILVPLIQGEPFHSIVGTGLKRVAVLCLIVGILGNVVEVVEQIFTLRIFDVPTLLLSEKISHVTVNYELDLTFPVIAAVLLLMSYIFRYGEELQKLSDETL